MTCIIAGVLGFVFIIPKNENRGGLGTRLDVLNGFVSVYYTAAECKPKNKNEGGLGIQLHSSTVWSNSIGTFATYCPSSYCLVNLRTPPVEVIRVMTRNSGIHFAYNIHL